VVEKKKKIGWVSRENISFYKFNLDNKDFITKDEVLKFEKNLLAKGLADSTESCPVFNFDSTKPKKRFEHRKKFDEKKNFSINRSFLSLFGFPAYGVHCNGWFKKNSSYHLMIAKRSNKLLKFPAHYDNLIAGGQPCGISIRDNLYKEGYEEAGLPKSIMKFSKKGSKVHYFHNSQHCFHSAVIFVYNIEINEDIKLKNIDGEVELFFPVKVDELYNLLENDLLKPNCIIPIADFITKFMYENFTKSTISQIKYILNSDG